MAENEKELLAAYAAGRADMMDDLLAYLKGDEEGEGEEAGSRWHGGKKPVDPSEPDADDKKGSRWHGSRWHGDKKGSRWHGSRWHGSRWHGGKKKMPA